MVSWSLSETHWVRVLIHTSVASSLASFFTIASIFEEWSSMINILILCNLYLLHQKVPFHFIRAPLSMNSNVPIQCLWKMKRSHLNLLASSMKGLLSRSESSFQSAPSLFEISELCIFGFSWAIFLLCPRDHTIKAFIGRLICSPAFGPGPIMFSWWRKMFSWWGKVLCWWRKVLSWWARDPSELALGWIPGLFWHKDIVLSGDSSSPDGGMTQVNWHKAKSQGSPGTRILSYLATPALLMWAVTTRLVKPCWPLLALQWYCLILASSSLGFKTFWS